MNLPGLRAGVRWWLSTTTTTTTATTAAAARASLWTSSSSAAWVVPGRGREEDTLGEPRTPRTPRKRTSSAATVAELLPHEDPVFLSKLETRRRSATPELARLRAYTLANRGGCDLATLSTLYAAAGMLKYASATMDRIYNDDSAPRPTASQWVELLEAGRRDRDPLFARDMVEAMQQRAGRMPSKRMQLVLLNTYAESGMAAEALRVYEEMAARHDTDVSMAMALLKACIRQRDLPESFVDMVVDVVGTGGRPLPRRVMSMVLMVRVDPCKFHGPWKVSRTHSRDFCASGIRLKGDEYRGEVFRACGVARGTWTAAVAGPPRASSGVQGGGRC